MASDSIQVNFQCPQCGESQTFEGWRKISAVDDPNLKQRLLSGELTNHTCSNCSFLCRIEGTGLRYIDHSKSLYIAYLDPESPVADESHPMRKGLEKAYKKCHFVNNLEELKQLVTSYDAESREKHIRPTNIEDKSMNQSYTPIPSDDKQRVPGVQLWGGGYVLRIVENCLFKFRHEKKGKWDWMDPSLVADTTRWMPDNLVVSQNIQTFHLKNANSPLEATCANVVKSSDSKTYTSVLLIHEKQSEENLLKAALSVQFNSCPTERYFHTYLICMHAKDEEVILGSTGIDVRVTDLLIMAINLVEHCPDIGMILPSFRIDLAQAPHDPRLSWIAEHARQRNEVETELRIFRESIGKTDCTDHSEARSQDVSSTSTFKKSATQSGTKENVTKKGRLSSIIKWLNGEYTG